MGVTSVGAAEPTCGRFRLATPAAAWALGALVLLLIVLAVSLGSVSGSGSAVGLSTVAVLVGCSVVGFLVARRRPENPIGWCLLGTGGFFALTTAAGGYAILDFRKHHGNLPLGDLAVLLQPAWAPAIALFAIAILLFPDGKLPSGRWRLPVGLFVAVGAVWLGGAFAIAASAIADHAVHIEPGGDLTRIDHPTADWAWWSVVQVAFFGLLAAIGLGWLAGQVPAYRRSTGIRRQQLKLMLAGGAIAVVGGVLSVGLSGSSTVSAVALLGLLGVPLAIGIGVLRYRLYDIDGLISRTLSYALLTGLLIGVFAGLVLLTTRVLPFSSPVGVAASTLAAAALFNPLRRRIQRLVDRRFNRARYDAEELVAAFGARLRTAVDPETVLTEFVAAATRTLQPAHASVWVKPPGA